MSADPVNHPPHYTSHPSGQECITFSQWLGFNVGNAFKYIWRCDSKGARDQDLQKALWYIDHALANPSTIPHHRTTDLPQSVHEGWCRVAATVDVDSPSHALPPLWETQFADTPRAYLYRARLIATAGTEVPDAPPGDPR